MTDAPIKLPPGHSIPSVCAASPDGGADQTLCEIPHCFSLIISDPSRTPAGYSSANRDSRSCVFLGLATVRPATLPNEEKHVLEFETVPCRSVASVRAATSVFASRRTVSAAVHLATSTAEPLVRRGDDRPDIGGDPAQCRFDRRERSGARAFASVGIVAQHH
jgi:hypothetical protein